MLPQGTRVICDLKLSNTMRGVKKTLSDFYTIIEHYCDDCGDRGPRVDLLLLYISLAYLLPVVYSPSHQLFRCVHIRPTQLCWAVASLFPFVVLSSQLRLTFLVSDKELHQTSSSHLVLPSR